MPHFRYSAMSRDGEAVAGELSAESRQQAIAALAERGNFVTDIAEAAAARAREAAPAWRWRARRVSLRAKASMLAQLATGLSAGLALLPALRAVEEQAEDRALRDLVRDVADRVQAGESLSDAFRAHPAEMSALEASMVRVGETAGALDEVMASLASFAERDLDFREKIRGAATYPVFVLALALVSVVIILTFVLPRILATVADSAAVLPWPTRFLMGLSDFLRYWGWLLPVAAAVAAWRFRVWVAKPQGRLAFDRLKLRTPIIGSVMRRVAVARFARTLGTLTQAGIQIIESMRVLRGTLGNEALAVKIDEITAGITQGRSIAEPLRQTGEFPPLLIQVIAMGERTGKLDVLLLKAADAYEKETAAAVQRAMSVLPAVLIVCLALVVAFILAAVLLPIVGMEITPPGT